MSLHPQVLCPIPEETARVARAAYPKGNLYMRIRDELGTLCQDERFADLFPRCGQSAEAPWRLLLVCLMQFAEGLSDEQAADAVRGRVDWKYMLSLELTDPGFDASVLCEFRQRLLQAKAGQLILQPLLDLALARGWLKARGNQRTDSTHVLGAIRALHRLETVGETMRATLGVLATVAPEWLRTQVSAQWVDRYEKRFEGYRLPKGKAERQQYAEVIGADGFQLLSAIYSETAPSWLREVPRVQVLRQVWVQQYYAPDGSVRWRTEEDRPPSALQIHSPVETTPATTYDGAVTQTIHAALEAKALLPEEHIVDSGYLDAEVLVSAEQRQQVTLIGPVAADTSWQARDEHSYEKSQFSIDWQEQQVTCPQGKTSRYWIPTHDRHGKDVIHIKFNPADCKVCPSRGLCTQAKAGARMLAIHPDQAQHQALQQARLRQKAPDFNQK